MIVGFSEIFDKLNDVLEKTTKLLDYQEFIEDDYKVNFLVDLGLIEDELEKVEEKAKAVLKDIRTIICG